MTISHTTNSSESSKKSTDILDAFLSGADTTPVHIDGAKVSTRTGYVAIVGRPNAGKSTFLNALIWESISAISSRPQTTQRTIPGIYTDEKIWVQIVFLDTPGIHHSATEQYGSQKSESIHTHINSQAFASLRNADVILRFLDPTRVYGDEDIRIDDVLRTLSVPILRIQTKGDMPKGFPHADVDMHINSMNKKGFPELVHLISRYLPVGPYLYSPDYYTDQPMDLRISEVVRQVLFTELGEELPYACYIEVASIEEKASIVPTKWSKYSPLKKGARGIIPVVDTSAGLLSIQAYIQVESESQKTIIVGTAGAKIQSIGTQARVHLERIFGKKVFLGLRVKVDKNWRKNEKVLGTLFPRN